MAGNPLRALGGFVRGVFLDGIVINIALLACNRVIKVISFPDYKLTPCQKQFQDYVTHPMPGRFEPRCSKTGAFQEIQCHGSSCFCVNREGIELPDTRRSLAMGNPVCSRPGNHLLPRYKLGS